MRSVPRLAGPLAAALLAFALGLVVARRLARPPSLCPGALEPSDRAAAAPEVPGASPAPVRPRR